MVAKNLLRWDTAETHPDYWATMRLRMPLGSGREYLDLMDALRRAHPDGDPQTWIAVGNAVANLEIKCGLNGTGSPEDALPLMRTMAFKNKYADLAASLAHLKAAALRQRLRAKSAEDTAKMRDDTIAGRGAVNNADFSDETRARLRRNGLI